MKYRKMGRTGLLVSEISLGCMNFGNQTKEPEAARIVQRAHELGINCFDTSNIYPIGGETFGVSEEIVGKLLKPFRHEVLISTKVGGGIAKGLPNQDGLSRANIMTSVEASLKHLQTDYIDLYLAHIPHPITPIDETLRAFDDLVRQGKVRYIGCSNFEPWVVCKSLWTSDKYNLARFDFMQLRYNLLSRSAEWQLIPFCASEGLGMFIYNPLAGGLLAGALYEPGGKVIASYEKGAPAPKAGRFVFDMYRARYWNDRNLESVKQLKEIARKYNRAPTDMSLAWLLVNKNITSILSLVDFPEQLNQNAAAIEIALSNEEILECNKIYEAMLPEGWLAAEIGFRPVTAAPGNPSR